jgi:hypothetical protein
MQRADTLEFLLGTWDLTREIEDHRAQLSGLFEGRATLLVAESLGSVRSSRRARYDESGELRIGTRTTRASRSLVYEQLNDASVMMRFTDGSPFVDLNLQGGEWHALHRCGDDLYEMVTTVCSESVIQERWRVTGPSKDYAAITRLTRVDQHSETSRRAKSVAQRR